MAGPTAQMRPGTQIPCEEDRQANRHEADFSRLRAALGLMRKNTAGGFTNCKFGDDLPALAADRPTGLERQGNTVITSMDLVICRNTGGAITSVEAVIARFCTFYLARAPPKDFDNAVQSRAHVNYYKKGSTAAMSEEELGYVRYRIQSMIHPCERENGDLIWGAHEHYGHAKCFCPDQLIFIFSNKERAMRDLRSLGCDLEKDFWTRAIYDLRELNTTYLIRRDAKARAPTTGGERTKITRDSRLPTLDEILKPKGFLSNGDPESPALQVLKAAIQMAVDDAINAGWVYAREQVDGGPFSQPQTFATADEADMFLLELHLARTRPVTRRILGLILEHEKARFQGLPPRLRIAFSVNRAQDHDLTSSLDMFARFAHVEKQNVHTIRLIRLASAEARLHRIVPPTNKFQYIAPVVITGATGISDATTSTHEEFPIGEELPTHLKETARKYKKVGREITTRLVRFLNSQIESWTEDKRAEVRDLYDLREYHDVDVEYPKMKSSRAFEELARKLRQVGYTMDGLTARDFITVIKGHRKLRDWYDRLPKDDPRSADNQNHEAWLQTLIEVVVILAGHKIRSETRDR